jgi:hypothetical protein
MHKEPLGPWVVYLAHVHGKPDLRAICGQAEWDKMSHADPAKYALIQSNIANEGVAEKLARGTSGDKPPRKDSRNNSMATATQLLP